MIRRLFVISSNAGEIVSHSPHEPMWQIVADGSGVYSALLNIVLAWPACTKVADVALYQAKGTGRNKAFVIRME